MIEEYFFGQIKIDGKTYTYDVEVRWTREVLSWQRKESHAIGIDDVKRAAEQSPGVIIIGTGEAGMAKVTQEAEEFIQRKGIRLIVDKTEEAVKTLNVILEESAEEEGEQQRAIGLFHLTC